MSYLLRPEIHFEITIWPPRISYRRGVWHAFGRRSRRLKYLPIPLKSDIHLGWATTRDGARNLGEGWGERP
jgi:hypothetical protein